MQSCKPNSPLCVRARVRSALINFPIAVLAFAICVMNGALAQTVSFDAPYFSDGRTGESYYHQLSADGGITPYRWNVVTGSLPAGLALNSNGIVSGTPSLTGTFRFRLGVTDAAGATFQRDTLIVVSVGSGGSGTPTPPPASTALTMTSWALPDGRVGTAYSDTMSSSGGVAPHTWSVASGSVPPGLTYSSSGRLYGTPATSGTFRFQVRVSDAAGASVVRDTMIVIAPGSFSISTSSLPSGVAQTNYSRTLQATGGTTPYTWSIVGGSLPAGVTLTSAGVLTGTPTAAGSFSFSVRSTDVGGRYATAPLTLVIAPNNASTLSINHPGWPIGRIGSAFSRSLTATGGSGPYSWSVAAGSLPPGLSMSSAGSVSGTPTAANTFDFDVRVADAAGRTTQLKTAITVVQPPTITTSSLPNGTVQQAYNHTVQATGGNAPYTWSVTGSLPSGLQFNAGSLSGTPTASGTSSITLRVVDAQGSSATRTLSLRIDGGLQLSISPLSLPAGLAGNAYSQTLSALGGIAPFSWSISSGALPAGLTLNATTGAITGTPTTSGSFTFTVRLDDSSLLSLLFSRTYTITVSAGLNVTTSALADSTVNQWYSQTLAASGGSAPYAWSLVSGSLPAGLNLSTNGTISGTPTVSGNFNLTLRATDASSTAATRTLPLSVAPAGQASEIAITSPAAGSAHSGQVTFAVNSPPPSGGSIEYILNGKAFSGPIYAAPFSYVWNSALVWSSHNRVEAVSRNASGQEVARSTPVAFRVARGSGVVQITSPDLTKTQSGVVNWTVNATHPDGLEGWSFILDGAFNMGWGNAASRSMPLDTTSLPNGRHELFNGVYSRANNRPPIGMGMAYITVDNGRAFMAVRPKYKDMFLSPGQSDTLSASLVYTDGFETPASGVTYTSSNAGVATVSTTGLVRAVAPGVANITVQANGRSAQTRIYVTNISGFPHFSKDGQILHTYDPARSLFVRSLFFLSNDEMNATPGLPQHVRAAGINAIATGFFNNPGDNYQPDLASWRRSFDDHWNRKVSDAARYGMSLMLIGDDIARTPRELSFVISSPWGAEALRYALTRARDSKVAVALDMVDEVSFVWGSTPRPSDGRWLRHSPSIPDNAFTTLMNIMNSVPGRTPMSWPIGGASGDAEVRNWLADPAFSDYSSSFFTYMDWRRGYPTASTIVQDRTSMQRVTADRYHLLQPNKPILVQNSITGPFYTKLTGNDEFTPGTDVQQEPPNGVRAVAAQATYAAVVGAAGIRSYGYDWSQWKQERLRNPIGSTDQQTGSDPFSVGTDRWHSFGAAYSLIGRLEPYLLNQRLSSPDLGGHVATTVRRGPASQMLMTVNMSEGAHPTTVDLTPYRLGGGSITRYRQVGGSVKVDVLSNSTTEDSVTFEGGECISWVFLPDATPTPGVEIVSPLPDSTISGTFNIQAAVSNTSNLSRVEFLVDGAVIRSTTAAPFTASWNAATVTRNIWHSIAVRAYDTSGNYNEARASVFTK